MSGIKPAAPYAASGESPDSLASSLMTALLGASRTPLLTRSIRRAEKNQYRQAVRPNTACTLRSVRLHVAE